jgi:hypothetical protein
VTEKVPKQGIRFFERPLRRSRSGRSQPSSRSRFGERTPHAYSAIENVRPLRATAMTAGLGVRRLDIVSYALVLVIVVVAAEAILAALIW